MAAANEWESERNKNSWVLHLFLSSKKREFDVEESVFFLNSKQGIEIKREKSIFIYLFLNVMSQ